MKTLLSLSLFLLLALMGCKREDSDTVDQDKIYQDYSLVYNGTEDKTYARASFRFSNVLGTALELAGGAEVKFNGQTMLWKNALAYYEMEFAGVLDSGTFAYTDADGNTFTNSIGMPDPISFPTNFQSLNQDGTSFTLSWVGNPLAADEGVNVSIEGTAENDLQLFNTQFDGATSIILGANKIGALGPGTADAWINRNRPRDLAEATSAGGVISGRYEGAKKQIQINP